MRILLLLFLLTGCASGNWAEYDYGPGDWLNENTALNVDTMYNYAHLIEPTIEIHYVESLSVYCGTMWVQGCAQLNDDRCDIYVGENASPGTIAHEKRHCRGWTHYRPRYEMFSAMGAEFRAREIRRASTWQPLDRSSTAVAMSQVRND